MQTGGNTMNTSGLDYTALTIAIIGAINFGTDRFLSKFDLVPFICGNMSWIPHEQYVTER